MQEQGDSAVLPPFVKGCRMIDQPIIMPGKCLLPKIRQLAYLEDFFKCFRVSHSQGAEMQVRHENSNLFYAIFAGLWVKAFASMEERLCYRYLLAEGSKQSPVAIAWLLTIIACTGQKCYLWVCAPIQIGQVRQPLHFCCRHLTMGPQR